MAGVFTPHWWRCDSAGSGNAKRFDCFSSREGRRSKFGGGLSLALRPVDFLGGKFGENSELWIDQSIVLRWTFQCSGWWAILAHAIVLVDAAIEDGVAAVNRFYDYCGVDERVKPDSHVNFSELYVGEKGGLVLDEQAEDLRERFEAALEQR